MVCQNHLQPSRLGQRGKQRCGCAVGFSGGRRGAGGFWAVVMACSTAELPTLASRGVHTIARALLAVREVSTRDLKELGMTRSTIAVVVAWLEH